MTQEEVLNTICLRWADLTSNNSLPAEDAILYQRPNQTFYYESRYGPSIPYPAFDRGDGTANHGYIHLKSSLELIERIPELVGWPEFSDFIRAINSSSSIESLGCEKGFSTLSTEVSHTNATICSYTDIVFSDPELTTDQKNYFPLALSIIESSLECEQWWGVIEIGLQRLKHFHGVNNPWGLMLRINNNGRTESEAREFWGETLRRIGSCISAK